MRRETVCTNLKVCVEKMEYEEPDMLCLRKYMGSFSLHIKAKVEQTKD